MVEFSLLIGHQVYNSLLKRKPQEGKLPIHKSSFLYMVCSECSLKTPTRHWLLCLLGKLPSLQHGHNIYFYKNMVRSEYHVYKRFGLLWLLSNFADCFNHMYWIRDISKFSCKGIAKIQGFFNFQRLHSDWVVKNHWLLLQKTWLCFPAPYMVVHNHL